MRKETQQGHVLLWVVSVERKGYFSEKSPFLGHTKAVHRSPSGTFCKRRLLNKLLES